MINPDGTVTYTPDANFNGSDTFTYVASDGTATSSPATVTITVSAVNDTPVAADWLCDRARTLMSEAINADAGAASRS